MMKDPQHSRSLPLDGRLPIVVGVTGHRDIPEQDSKMLESAVRQRIEGLLKAFPDTPVVVLSALAEGADQLVARVAIGLRETRYQDRLFIVAPLPWDVETYFQTFILQTDEARATLDALLAQCDASYPVEVMESSAPWTTPTGLEESDEGFRRLAAFMVRNAHVLLALSEEGPQPGTRLEPTGWTGGSANVQGWFLHGLPAHYSPGVSDIDLIDGLLLWHLPVRRSASSPAPAVQDWSFSSCGEPQSAPPIAQAPFGLGAQVFDNFQGFNRTLEVEQPRFRSEIVESGDNLLGWGKESPQPPAALEPLRDAFAAADVLTDNRFRPYIDAFGVFAVIAVAVAVLAFEVFTHILPGSYGFLALYVLTFLSLPVLSRFLIQGRSLDEKRLVYRSLAESLRLQAYWRYAGVNRMVSHYYSRHARNEVEWVRQAVRGLFPCCAPMPDSPPAWTRIGEVTTHWVRGQQSYFLDKTENTLHPKERLVSRVSHTGLGLGFGIAIFLVARFCISGEGGADHGHLDHATHLWIAAMISAIAVAGIAQWVEHTKAYGPLARRYESQAKTYARAGEQLEFFMQRRGPQDLARARAVLRDLGRATLMENTSWLLLFRNRPLEIHWH